MPVHYFTVQEANALLPQVRRVLGDMLDARQRILDAQPELWPVLEKALDNGGSKKAGELVKEFERVECGAQTLNEMGCILPDINVGLVDFPTLRNGQEALLCWRCDEPTVGYWHNLESGFTDRQPI